MKNLTRGEAEHRAALLDVASYDVQLDLTHDDGFASVCEIRFACREPGASTFVELDGELVAAELNGEVLTAGLVGNRLALPDLRADNVLRVVARCSFSRTGEGLHRFVDPADDRVYLWTQSFLDDAQRVFACFDQPDLKAVVRLAVDAPEGWTVVANARGEQRGRSWAFAPTERISTYLFTVAAGPWHGVHERYDDRIDLGLWCRQSLAEHLDADELFEVTRQCFAFQERLFGRDYPFGDTYDQLFVPEFNHGAMENPGAVTFTEEFVFRSRVTEAARRTRAMVVAHELSHMWFGDLVTMRWFDDLWLNESFAELLGFLTVDRATRFSGGWTDFATRRKAWGYRADQLPTTHPVSGEVPDTRSALLNFDGISYAKGASVLLQLMTTVGEQAFFDGVRSYLARHAFGSTCFGDLLAEVERSAGRDLGDWADAWLRSAGVSTLRTVVDGDRVLVRQEPAPGSDVLREHALSVGLYDDDGEALRLRSRFDVAVRGPEVVLPLDAADLPDLLLVNDGDRTFAKLRLEARSTATLRTGVGRLADPLARALCWGALWDALRDAELPAADLVASVLSGVGVEDDPGVVETLLTQARTAARLHTAHGAPLLGALAEASWAAARSLPAGSDLQLVQVRAFAAAADAPAHAAVLEALLAGDDVPAGLVVDTDLRWLLVQRLAALGRLGEDDVDAERARDRTAAGHRQALRALAARPDPAAKEHAFTRATTDPELSNHEAEALAGGFWQPGQDALCAPYVDRYLEVLPALWRDRSPQVAQELGRLLFPGTLVDAGVLDRVDTMLERPDLPAGLRRVVREQAHDLRRAVRSRAVEAG